MFVRHFSALACLALLAGCASAPGSMPHRASVESTAPTAPTAPATITAEQPAPAATTAVTRPASVASVHAATASPTHPTPTPVGTPVAAANKAVAAPVQAKPKSATEIRRVRHVDRKPKSSGRRKAVKTSEPDHPTGGVVHGRVVLAAAAGRSVSAQDMSDTLVFFAPHAMKAHPRPGKYTIYTNHHQFQPGAMAVPLGSTIDFVNLDSVDHNVFSVTPGNRFNLGYQSQGQKASHTFRHPGLVLIGCNVHPSMEVDLLVEPSPYVARVDADGRFTLRDLPSGSGTVYAWNPRAGLTSQAADTASDASVQLRLTLTRPPVETELNMAGQP